MATGTGKTYTAFQIIWRLWKAGRAKRVLFLADRNILVDQAIQNDFRPFGGAMVKVQNREADKAYEVYLALYQAVTRDRGTAEHLPRVLARLLRPHRRGRVPPGERVGRTRRGGRSWSTSSRPSSSA